jgi:hypothetical protein
MDHRIGRGVFALVVGLLVAGISYQWITNPDGREQRVIQVAIVEAAREELKLLIEAEALEIVDPLSPNRKVGKVYVYPEGENWAVSGYYRRGEGDRWHPYLMGLTSDRTMSKLKLQDRDQRLTERATMDPMLEVSP